MGYVCVDVGYTKNVLTRFDMMLKNYVLTVLF